MFVCLQTAGLVIVGGIGREREGGKKGGREKEGECVWAYLPCPASAQSA